MLKKVGEQSVDLQAERMSLQAGKVAEGSLPELVCLKRPVDDRQV